MGKKYHIDPKRQLMEFGSTKHEIVRVARENKIDLIVIGSHERYGLDYLLGSTAHGVVHAADCDVLVVRLEAK